MHYTLHIHKYLNIYYKTTFSLNTFHSKRQYNHNFKPLQMNGLHLCENEQKNHFLWECLIQILIQVHSPHRKSKWCTNKMQISYCNRDIK